MKARLGTKQNTRGFNTLEIIIALALMIVVIVGAVNANISAQYWSMTSETSNEGLYKAKTIIEQLRASSSKDFQSASSSALTVSMNPSDSADTACIAGGMCYSTKRTVLDISSCSKFTEAYVEWRLGMRYPTTTESLYTNLTNNNEIIALGGDCLLNEPEGDWISGSLDSVGSLSLTPTGAYTTGIDVLQKRVYLVSSTSPQLRVFAVPGTPPSDPSLLGSTAGKGRRLNSVDAVRDMATGRTYAFATQHASTSQLAVFDVTDSSLPTFVSERTLSGVDKSGDYPEGWRVTAYGGRFFESGEYKYEQRLYVTTRETTGPELHIFNTNAPTQPTEIVSAATSLNRTVNDMVVREQMHGGTLHRYLFLAEDPGTSPYTKHLRVYDVTDDTPTEVAWADLSVSADALSLFLTGNRLYLGRASGSGPELYVFDVDALLNGGLVTPLASSEVGADVSTIRGTGKLLFLGTSKSGEEFQVWHRDESTWSDSVLNAGRISFQNVPRLAPLGLDVNVNWVYTVSQSASLSELLKVIYKDTP